MLNEILCVSEGRSSLGQSSLEIELHKFSKLAERASEKIRQQRNLISNWKTKFEKAEERLKEMENECKVRDKQSKKTKTLVGDAEIRVKKAEKESQAANKRLTTLQNQLEVMKKKNELLEARCKELKEGNENIFVSVKELLADCFQSKKGKPLAKKRKSPPSVPRLLQKIANASKRHKKVKPSPKPQVAVDLSEEIDRPTSVDTKAPCFMEKNPSSPQMKPNIKPVPTGTGSSPADRNKSKALNIPRNNKRGIVKPDLDSRKKSMEATKSPAKKLKLSSSGQEQNLKSRNNFAVRSNVIAKSSQLGLEEDPATSNVFSGDEKLKVKIEAHDSTTNTLITSHSDDLIFPQLGESELPKSTQNMNGSVDSQSTTKKKDYTPEPKSTEKSCQSIVKDEKVLSEDELVPTSVSVSSTPKPTIVEPSNNIRTCRYFVNGSCVHGEKCKFAHDVCPLYQLGKCAKGVNCQFKHEKMVGLYKTRPCMFYASGAVCPHGSECTFIHSVGDIKRKSHLVSQFLNTQKIGNVNAPGPYQVNGLALKKQWQVCKFFISGNCTNGQQCTYAHPIPTLVQPPNLAPPGNHFPVNYNTNPSLLNKPIVMQRGPFSALLAGANRNQKKSFRCLVCSCSFLGHFAFNKHLTDSGHRNLQNQSR